MRRPRIKGYDAARTLAALAEEAPTLSRYGVRVESSVFSEKTQALHVRFVRDDGVTLAHWYPRNGRLYRGHHLRLATLQNRSFKTAQDVAREVLNL